MMTIVALGGIFTTACGIWLGYRLVREVKHSIELEQQLGELKAAADYLNDENERLMRIMASNRETRRAASSQARRLVGRA